MERNWEVMIDCGILYIEKEAYNDMKAQRNDARVTIATLTERVLSRDREIELLKEQITYLKK